MNKGTEVGGKNDLANKRIVQIAPISSHGGISTHLVNLLDAIPKFGANVTLIGISDKKNNPLSCDYILITNKRNPNGYTYLFNLWLKAPFLKIASTDVICTHRPDDMFPFILFHRKNPKVCTLHGKIFENIYLKHEKIIAKVYGIVEKFTLKRLSNCDASSVVAVDETTERYFISKYPWLKNKITVIPIGIDLNKFKPMNKENVRRKYGFDTKDKIIIYVGRLEKEKNLDLLIKSFVLVKKYDPHAKLALVGRESTLK
jgi:glycosyltransferase involved in cell wall biosynthesis